MAAGVGTPVLDEMQAQGFRVSGHKIDWLTSPGGGQVPQVEARSLHDADGIILSDHTLAVGTYAGHGGTSARAWRVGRRIARLSS